MATVQEIIICTNKRGRGIEADPYREVTEFWTKDGQVLGVIDHYAPEYNPCTGGWIVQKDMKIERKNNAH